MSQTHSRARARHRRRSILLVLAVHRAVAARLRGTGAPRLRRDPVDGDPADRGHRQAAERAGAGPGLRQAQGE